MRFKFVTGSFFVKSSSPSPVSPTSSCVHWTCVLSLCCVRVSEKDENKVRESPTDRRSALGLWRGGLGT